MLELLHVYVGPSQKRENYRGARDLSGLQGRPVRCDVSSHLQYHGERREGKQS